MLLRLGRSRWVYVFALLFMYISLCLGEANSFEPVFYLMYLYIKWAMTILKSVFFKRKQCLFFKM